MKPPTPTDSAISAAQGAVEVMLHMGHLRIAGIIEAATFDITGITKVIAEAIQAERDRVRAAVPEAAEQATENYTCECGECRECGFNACRALWVESLGGEDE